MTIVRFLFAVSGLSVIKRCNINTYTLYYRTTENGRKSDFNQSGLGDPMAYIDKDYYDNEFKGVPIDESTFSRYAERASDLIDQMTNYVLWGKFDSFPPFIQEMVKKATAAQVEYYFVQGGPEQVDSTNDPGEVRIGNFSYGSRGGSGRGEQRINRQENRVSPSVIGYLAPTGLLYRGLDVVDRVY